MALTPEEQKELEQLDQELGSEGGEDVQASTLTPEEEQELQQLDQELGPQEEASENSGVHEFGSDLLATTRKVAKGFLPVSNQISAGLSAVADYATDPLADAIYGTTTPPSTFGEKYNKNLEIIREQEKEDTENLGLVGTAAEVTGAATGLGKAAKLLNITKFSAKNVAATGALDAAYAAASYTDSQGYDGDVQSVMRNGLAFSVGAQVLAGPLAKGVAGLGRRALAKTDDALVTANIKRYADETGENLATFKKTHGDDALKKTMDDLNMTDPEMAANPTKFKQNVRQVLDESGSRIGGLYETLEAISGGVPVNPTTLLDKVNKRVLSSVSSPSAKRELADSVLPKINNMFKNSIEPDQYAVNSLTDLHNTLDDLNKGNILADVTGKPKEILFKTLRDELKTARTKVVSQLESGVARSKQLDDLMTQKKILEDAVEGGKKQGVQPSPSNVAKLEELDANIANLEKAGVKPKVSQATQNVIESPKMVESIVKDITEENAKYSRLADFNKNILSKEMPKSQGGYMVNALKNAFSAKGAMGAILGGASGGPVGAVIGATGAGMGSKAASTASRYLESFIGTTREAGVRRGVAKLSSFFDNVSQYNTDPVFRGLSAVVAKNLGEQPDVSADQAWVNIEGAMAKAELYKSPIERNKESVVEKFDQIMALASVESPELAASLADAMNNQEDVGPIMDTLSKRPALAKLFKAGFGWDGKVYSEEDKMRIVSEISSQNDIPSVAKKGLIANVMSTGEIPDMSQVPRRQPMEYKPRDRNKVR